MSRGQALLAANPFPGLRPFRPEEADRFFGRRQQIDELLALLATRRLIAVAGASGSGKSSLVLAGLLSALAQRYADGDELIDWRPVVMRPGGAPITQLADKLAQLLANTGDDAAEIARRADTLYGQLRLGGNGLVEVVRRARLPAQAQVLLVVDQFEELFRFTQVSGAATDAEEASAFVKLLLQAAADVDAPLRIVLTLRSDTLGLCAEFHGLPEAVSRGQYLVPRLKREQRKEAITRPVDLRGARIAPRLVQRLLNDVSDDFDDLPVMQHALSRTWARWALDCQGSRPIDLEDYIAVGGATEALSRHANEAAGDVNRALPEQPRIVEQVFRALTERLPGGAEVRRPLRFATLCAVCTVPTDDAASVAAAVATVLERYRRLDTAFLVPAPEVGLSTNPVIDISHESLIRQWTELRGWVADESADKANLLRLVGDADRADKVELWRGLDLQNALAWQTRARPTPAWVGLCTGGDGPAQFARANAFLAASQASEARERARQQRQRWALRGLGALVVVVLVVAALNNAVQQRSARAGELANQALLELPRDPARSAHLAALALDHDAASPRAEFALRQAMATLEVAYAEHVLAFDGPVADARWAADRSQVVVAAGNSASVIDAKTWAPLGPPLKFDSPLRRAWLVGGGAKRWVLALAEDGQLRVQAASGGPVTLLACSGKDNPVYSAAVSPPDSQGSEQIALGCFDGEIISARATTAGVAGRQVLASRGVDGATVTALGFSGDGQYLASGNSAGSAQVWKSGQVGPWLTGDKGSDKGMRHAAAIRDIGFHPKYSDRLASASDDGTAAVWYLDLANRRLSDEHVVLQHGHAVSLARFASRVDDDAQLLSVADKRVFFWTDKDHHAERAHDDAVVDAAVSGDGELIVSASADGTARVWSTRSGTPVAVLRGHKSELTRAFFGANLGQDRSLLTAGTDNSLRVWRLRPPTLLAAQPGWIRSLAVDRSGQQLALCGDMGAPGSSGAKTKAESGVPLCRLMPPTDLAGRTKDDPVVVSGPANTAPLASASLSADGQWLIGQPADGLGKPRALLWPLRPQVGTALTPAWLNGVSGAVFSRDAAVLATLNEGAKDGGAITLWDAATLSVSAANPPNVVARFAARPERSVLAVSPDGRWIAASEGKRVTLLDARASSTAPRILGAHLGDVRALAFSRDSQALVSAGSDRMALVWPVAATGPPAKPVRLAGGHTAALSSAAFSPDGKQVVTASSDNSIRVWNAASGHELAALRRHGDAVNLVAFAPSGNAILSVSDDGTAKLGDCTACNTALDDLRAQVGQRIDLDPVDKIAFAAESRPWLPWLRWPSAKR